MNVMLVKCPWCDKEFNVANGVWHRVPIHDTSRRWDDHFIQVDYQVRNTEHRCKGSQEEPT